MVCFLVTNQMIFSRELFFNPSENYSSIYMRLFQNLKAIILKGIITWSEKAQQTPQARRFIKNIAQQIRDRYFEHILIIYITFTPPFEKVNID